MTSSPGRVVAPARSTLFMLRTFLCAVIGAESMCYGVISPLLPRLADDLALDNLGIGLLMGAFTTGMLPACIALMVLRRPSDLFVLLTGVIAVAAGCLVFANVSTFGGPLAGRVLMGFGSALCFSGATQWMVRSAPGSEAFYFGLGWGMLSVGTALGPLLGSLAVAHGAAAVHNALAVLFVLCAVGLALLALSPLLRRIARASNEGSNRAAWSLLRDSDFRAGLTPVIVPALAIGLCFTLIPLRFADAGAQGWIAATFTAAAIIGAAAGPLGGTAVRRLGPQIVTTTALLLGAVVTLVLAWSLVPWLVALAAIIVLGVSNEVTTVGGSELIRIAGSRLGNPDAAPVFVTLVFAVFETFGAVLSAKSQDLHAAIPYIVLAVTGLVMGLRVMRRRSH